jgi:hypothetical protein
MSSFSPFRKSARLKAQQEFKSKLDADTTLECIQLGEPVITEARNVIGKMADIVDTFHELWTKQKVPRCRAIASIDSHAFQLHTSRFRPGHIDKLVVTSVPTLLVILKPKRSHLLVSYLNR